jgi:hypothetical protein
LDVATSPGLCSEVRECGRWPTSSMFPSGYQTVETGLVTVSTAMWRVKLGTAQIKKLYNIPSSNKRPK